MIWVKMLDSGQTIEMVDGPAKRFIALGHAVEIPAPPPAPASIGEFKTPEPKLDPLYTQAYSLAHEWELPAKSWRLAARIMRDEETIQSLLQRVEALETNPAAPLAAAVTASLEERPRRRALS
jgi:hypothetical protein